MTGRTVEIYLKSEQIAVHVRKNRKRGFTTVDEHMPESHQQFRQLTALRQRLSTAGPATEEFIRTLLNRAVHPVHCYRSLLGLGRQYGAERLEAACQRALDYGACRYPSVASILKNQLDSQLRIPPIQHEKVRGPDYYENL